MHSATGTARTPIRILAVDDHPVFRVGLGALIGSESDMQLVGEACTGREAIEQYKVLRPDVTLLDLQMPDGSGLDAITAIRAEDSSAKIIVLTTYAGDARAQRALKAGAQGYVLKAMIRKELLESIRAVFAGQRRIHVEVATQMAAHVASDGLSDREIQVLTYIAGGNTNRKVANLLSISEETVKGHVKCILAKLGASDRTHAVMLAVTRGFLTV